APARRTEGESGTGASSQDGFSQDGPTGPAAKRRPPRGSRARGVAVTIAEADDGFDALISELPAEGPDVHVNGTSLDVGIVIPETRQNRVARHHAAPAANQEPEQVELLLG